MKRTILKGLVPVQNTRFSNFYFFKRMFFFLKKYHTLFLKKKIVATKTWISVTYNVFVIHHRPKIFITKLEGEQANMVTCVLVGYTSMKKKANNGCSSAAQAIGSYNLGKTRTKPRNVRLSSG